MAQHTMDTLQPSPSPSPPPPSNNSVPASAPRVDPNGNSSNSSQGQGHSGDIAGGAEEQQGDSGDSSSGTISKIVNGVKSVAIVVDDLPEGDDHLSSTTTTTQNHRPGQEVEDDGEGDEGEEEETTPLATPLKKCYAEKKKKKIATIDPAVGRKKYPELHLNLNQNKQDKRNNKKKRLYENPFAGEETGLLFENGAPKNFQEQEGDEEEEEQERHVQFDNDDERRRARIDADVVGSGNDDEGRKSQNASSPTKSAVPSSGANSRSSSGSSSSSSSSSSEESLEISEARPPDGGWGWVVVAASFVVNLIADGITFSFGVIYREFLDYFGYNRGTTAWVGSLFMAMPLLSGPIASFLTDRYGCRKVTIIGSILATAGFIISSTADSMIVLCATFGILAGFGLSLCYVASVVIVAYYFDKKRSFATGLAVCGSGIGTFIFAPLIQALLDEYGWRGTTLILAGLFLNLAVCGALMRDLPWTSSRKKKFAEKRNRKRRKRRAASKSGHGSSADSFSVSNSTNTASVLQTIIEAQEDDGDEDDVNPDRLCSSLVNLPTYVKNGEKVPIEVIELLSTHKNVYNVLMQNYPSLLTPSRSFSDSGRLNEAHHATSKLLQNASNGRPNIMAPSSPTNTDAAYLWWLKRNQITPPRLSTQKKITAAYLRDVRVHRLSLTYRGAMLNINRYRLRASSCPDIYRNSMTTIAKEKVEWYAGLWDLWYLIVDMFDFSHFADSKFLLFAISNFLLYTWYDVPYVYITDNAVSKGFTDSDASMLVGMIGIVNMFGEIFLGWAGDQPWINAGIVYAVCMTLCGTVTAIVPLLSSYWTLSAVSGAFGLFIAANYSLTCIILVELITLERFTNAYGLLLLVQGVANLIGPPLGGWICDITGTYDLSFYLAGFFIAVSGVLLVILPATKRYRRFQNLQRQASSDENSIGNKGCAKESSPEEPKFHRILASCITGKVVEKNGSDNKVDNVNHV